jgi:hypothetical protein
VVMGLISSGAVPGLRAAPNSQLQAIYAAPPDIFPRGRSA